MLLLLLSKKKPQTVENFYKFNYIQKNKELSLPLITYNLAIQSEKILKPSTLFIEQQFWFDTISFLKDTDKKVMLTASWFLSKYLKTSLGVLTGFQTEWKFINIKLFQLDESCYAMWYRVYRTQILSFFFTKRVDFITLFTRLTVFRDPTALVPFIKKHLLQTHLKQHNRIFYSVCTFMSNWYFFAINAQRIKGYSVFFKGKLAKKGSVRKSVFFKKKGSVSFTNKGLRVNYRNYFVWTYTGVIGAGLSIFY